MEGRGRGLGGRVPLRMNHCSKTKCCEKGDDDDVCVCSSVGMVEGRLGVGVGVYKCRGRVGRLYFHKDGCVCSVKSYSLRYFLRPHSL